MCSVNDHLIRLPANHPKLALDTPGRSGGTRGSSGGGGFAVIRGGWDLVADDAAIRDEQANTKASDPIGNASAAHLNTELGASKCQLSYAVTLAAIHGQQGPWTTSTTSTDTPSGDNHRRPLAQPARNRDCPHPAPDGRKRSSSQVLACS